MRTLSSILRAPALVLYLALQLGMLGAISSYHDLVDHPAGEQCTLCLHLDRAGSAVPPATTLIDFQPSPAERVELRTTPAPATSRPHPLQPRAPPLLVA